MGLAPASCQGRLEGAIEVRKYQDMLGCLLELAQILIGGGMDRPHALWEHPITSGVDASDWEIHSTQNQAPGIVNLMNWQGISLMNFDQKSGGQDANQARLFASIHPN